MTRAKRGRCLRQPRSEGRQVGERGQAKALKKLVGRAVQHRPANPAGPAKLLQQTLSNQRAQDALAVDAPHLFELATADWLAVGDNCQHFQRRGRQLARRLKSQKVLDLPGVLGRRHELSAGRAELKPNSAGLKLLAKTSQRPFELDLTGAEKLAQSLDRHGFARDEENAFEEWNYGSLTTV
jgi:hypothetical protein